MGSRVSGNEQKPSGHTWPLTVPCGPPLQVLALCHIAVGQQMSLHWLHKVRRLRGAGGRETGLQAQQQGKSLDAPSLLLGRRPSSLWVTATVVPAATQLPEYSLRTRSHTLASANPLDPHGSPVMWVVLSSHLAIGKTEVQRG